MNWYDNHFSLINFKRLLCREKQKFRVILKRYPRMLSPISWTASITGAMTLQSTKNWVWSSAKQRLTTWLREGLIEQNWSIWCHMLVLSLLKEGQVRRKFTRSPSWAWSVPLHNGSEHIPRRFSGVKNLEDISSKYLPETNCIWIIAFSISNLFDPQVPKIGWEFERLINSGLK